MGGLASKHLDLESMMHTPEKEKQEARPCLLKTDPRSPSDNVSRTPIAVMNRSDRAGDHTPADDKTGSFIAEDPRSPSIQVDRTPIVLLDREGSRSRLFSLRPSRLVQVPDSTEMDKESELDPRSPSRKMRRTPVGSRSHSFEPSEASVCSEVSADVDSTETKAVSSQDEILEKKKKLENVSFDKIRRPLTSVQNTVATTTPRGMLQAKQCKNVEEEYNKSQQVLRTQLPHQEKVVVSKTEFVESI